MSRISMARTTTTSSSPASRAWRARCAPPSRSTRARPMRCPRPRAFSAANPDRTRHVTTIVIDYGSGNLRSAAKALERAAAEAGCGERIAVSADAAEVARADRIVLPGVGAFADGRRGLDDVERKRDG